MICKRDSLNNKAMKAFGCALISDEFNRVCNYEMAKALEIDNFCFSMKAIFFYTICFRSNINSLDKLVKC